MESTGIGRRALLAGTAAATTLAATRLLPTPAVAAPKPSTADSERIARQLLQLDEHGGDLKLQALRILIDNGLPKTDCPKKILIVGAGIAGLTTALLLKNAGHEVTILEANANRTGGRIKTFHGKYWRDGRLHAEAGAMRIPSHHPLVLALVDKLDIPRRRFHLADVPRDYTGPTDTPPVVYRAATGETWTNKPQEPTPRPGDITPDTGNTLILANGITTTRKQYLATPGPLNSSFGTPTTDNVGILLTKALKPLLPSPTATPEQRLTHWAKLIATTDDYSLYRYLEEVVGWDLATIRLTGTLANFTSRLPLSLLHTLTDYVDIDTAGTYWELDEGTDALTNTLTDKMRPQLRMNQRVVRIVQTDTSVQVHAVPENGDETTDTFPQRITQIYDADNVVITAPFPALQFIEFEPALSYNKRRAITELHYDAATKVLLEFSHRFWEDGPTGWRGGGSITDGPNRFVYYPSYSPQRSNGGIILASYTWADDARRWDPLTPGERQYFALQGLATLHGKDVYKHFTGYSATQSWASAKWALGEAAVFTPGQAHDVHLATFANEGRLHFAGEHTSLKHAWIEGSLESAVRAALEVN